MTAQRDHYVIAVEDPTRLAGQQMYKSNSVLVNSTFAPRHCTLRVVGFTTKPS